MTAIANLQNAVTLSYQQSQVQAALNALAAGGTITAVTITVPGTPPAPPSSFVVDTLISVPPTVVTALQTIIQNRLTAIQNALTGLGVTAT